MNVKQLNLKNLELEIGRHSVILHLENYLKENPTLNTNKQKTIANYLFFNCTKMKSRGIQAIFKINSGKHKGKFISYDIGSGNGSGSHKGGVWKVASTEKKLLTGNRDFTANIDLTKKIDK